MKSIAIDMDQVLADFIGKTVEAFNKRFNENVMREDFLLAELKKRYPQYVKEFFLMINEPDYFRDFELIDEDSVPVLRELNEHYDIYIATAAMDIPGSFNAKYDWLVEHFPFLDTAHFIFCGDKKVVKADYLIDDSVRQLKSFTGEGILYSQPYNLQCNDFKRVHNWKEIRDLFLPVES